MWFFALVIYCTTLNVVAGLTATACQSSYLTLVCPVPMTILSANYGRLDKTTCPATYAIGSSQLNSVSCNASAASSLSLVSSKCNGMLYCSVYASHAIFGDPCNGIAKYLTVTYSCPVTNSITSVACENSTLTLQCPTGYIDVLSYNYGRLDNTTCPAGNAIGSYPLNNTACTATQFPTLISYACNGKTNCSIPSNTAFFGYDPCPGIAKYLTVTFSCIAIATQAACENATLNLQCPSGTIAILGANYGRLDTATCGNSGTTDCVATMSLTVVNNSCNGQQNCSLPVLSGKFSGDPCTAVSKYLTATYYCQAVPTANITTVGCDNTTFSMQCATGTIYIWSANYGRLDQTTCPGGYTNGSSALVNTTCTYAGSLNVTSAACNGRANCSIVVNLYTFGGVDPCQKTAKYLTVTYSCVTGSSSTATTVASTATSTSTTSVSGVNITTVACDNTTFSIQCAPRVICVWSAKYGRFDQTTCRGGYAIGSSVLANAACTAATSLGVVNSTCNGKANCSFVVSTATFGDPCFGTLKYLTVTYSCIAGSQLTTTTTTTTTTKPSTTTSTSTTLSTTTKSATTTSITSTSTATSATPTVSLTTTNPTTTSSTTAVVDSSIATTTQSSDTNTIVSMPDSSSETATATTQTDITVGAVSSNSGSADWLMWTMIGTVAVTSVVGLSCFCLNIVGGIKHKQAKSHQPSQT